VSEMRAACSRRREQAIVSLCSLIATDASENQRTDISVLGFYRRVCYKSKSCDTCNKDSCLLSVCEYNILCCIL
jgi:hypothetical protein